MGHMAISWHDLKKAVYVCQTIFGIMILIFALNMPQSEDITNFLASIILAAVGCALIMFGTLTFFLKSDPDVWR
jgi:membrane-bound ClpP family serine protease